MGKLVSSLPSEGRVGPKVRGGVHAAVLRIAEVPSVATPSVAFGDASPSRGEEVA